jgi:anti-sigma factor RsiW
VTGHARTGQASNAVMTEVSCDRCAALLGDYVDGVLAADVRDAFEAHVGSCGACSTLVCEYRAIPDIVRRGMDAAMPDAVEARLRRLLAIAHGRDR